MDPGGRFAIFDEVIVDVAAERVAWLYDGEILPIRSAGHRVVRAHREHPGGVELWDLDLGSVQTFAGTLVEHVGLPGRAAVQRGSVVDVIDTVLGERVAILPASGVVLSVASSGSGWRVLARTGRERDLPGLVLLSSAAAPSRGVRRLPLSLPAARFSLAERTSIHSDPFLAVGAHGQISVNVLEACGECESPGQFSLWASVLDPQTGQGTAWSELRFSREHPPDGIMPIAGPHIQAHAPMPPSVERHIAQMRLASDLGVLMDVSPSAQFALTVGSNRVCVWSLERGERAWCEPRDYPTYEFMDSTHVWMLVQQRDRTELGTWDLVSRRSSRRTFARGTFTVPGPNERFLLSWYDQNDHSYAAQAWAFASSEPLWTHEGCSAEPYFVARGAQVVCPMSRPSEPRVLDASDGRALAMSQTRLRPERAPRPCGLTTSTGFDIQLRHDDAPIATLFDLSESEWAVRLPSGQFRGTTDAVNYLAFYDALGQPLARGQVQRLRDDDAVERAFAALQRATRGCVE